MGFVRTIIRKTGTLIGVRRTINLIEGSNVTLTVADDIPNDRVNVTIAASGGSGSPGGSDTYVQYNDGGAFGGEADFTYDKTTNKLTIDLIHTATLQAHTSAGIVIEATGGADCALFGAGGGQNVTFYDGVKLDAGTASAVLITDSSKNISYLALAANESIRRNASNTAYEAYTPSNSSPDLVITKYKPALDQTITAGYSAYYSGYYEIADTKFLEIGNGSTLEIG